MCSFGILLTGTSEEGLPVFKVEVAEYFPLLVFEETAVSKNWKAFCLSVNEISGHIWVNMLSEECAIPYM